MEREVCSWARRIAHARVFRNAGFTVAAEAFADRRYERGTLRSRKFEDALIRDAAEAAQQALRIVEQGTAQTSASTAIHPALRRLPRRLPSFCVSSVELRL